MLCRIFRNPEYNTSFNFNETIHLVKYNPWHDGHNPNFDEFSGLILDVKQQKPKGINYFTDQLRSILSNTEEYVICVIPTHEIGAAPSGIRAIAKKLCNYSIIDGTDIIIRIKEMQKKSSGGSRNLKSEIESLLIRDEGIVKDKQILLLDDVTTSGTSLKAGKYILEKAGAKLVIMFALGQTQ